MFVLRLNAAAGPSRTLRALRVSALPISVPPRAPVVAQLANARWSSTSAPRANTNKAAAPQWSKQSVLKNTVDTPRGGDVRGKLTTAQWPWHPVQPPLHKDQIEEERVIYARPSTTNPKIFWAMLILYGSGLVMYFVLPSPEEARQKGFAGEEGTILGLPTGSFMSYLAGGTMTTFTVIAFFGLVFPSRLITRLSLIRSRPASAPNSTPKEFIRMSHMGHQMVWGKRSQPREIPVQDVEVKVILGRQTKGGERERLSWLNLKVHSPNSNSKFSFDGYGYRLDFRHTPALDREKREVVMSLARIQDVFGKLDVSNPLPAAAPKAVKVAKK